MNLFAHENQHSNGNIFFGEHCCKPSAVTPHPGYSLREAALDLQSEDGGQAFPMSLLVNSRGVEDRQAIGLALAVWPGLLSEDTHWSEARLAAAVDEEDEDDEDDDEDIEDDDDLKDEEEEDIEDEEDYEEEEEDEDEDEDYEDEDDEEE